MIQKIHLAAFENKSSAASLNDIKRKLHVFRKWVCMYMNLSMFYLNNFLTSIYCKSMKKAMFGGWQTTKFDKGVTRVYLDRIHPVRGFSLLDCDSRPIFHNWTEPLNAAILLMSLTNPPVILLGSGWNWVVLLESEPTCSPNARKMWKLIDFTWRSFQPYFSLTHWSTKCCFLGLQFLRTRNEPTI